MTPPAVALIPARAGSLRVPGKNVRPLAGHPLIAYSIAAAHESGAFETVVVSTDSEEIAEIARHYGADVPCLRPPELATSTSPDIDWVAHMIGVLSDRGERFELFSILRPTSPFRTGATIQRARSALFAAGDEAQSVRAVRRCREHPAKMWVREGLFLRPLLPQPAGEVPLHSRQFQALPEVYVQDSSLEFARIEVLADARDIAGERVVLFTPEGREGFSIDYPEEFEMAEHMIAAGEAFLPPITQPPFVPERQDDA